MTWGSLLVALFTNFCVLITFTFFGSLTFTNETSGSPGRRRLTRLLLTAAAGMVLLFFAVRLPGDVLLDLRKVPVALAGLFSGSWAALLVALPVAAYRLWLGSHGVAAHGALVANFGLPVVALLSGVLWRRVLRGRQASGRHWWLYALSLGVSNLSVFLVPGIAPGVAALDFAALTSFHTLGLVAAVAVLNVRFRATSRQSAYRSQAYRDALTGLYNRRQFDEDLLSLTLADRAQLIMFDVDHFKRLNDTHGHSLGDEVLRALGALLSAQVDERARAYRLGGEEFAVLLRHSDGLTAARMADGLRERATAHLATLLGAGHLPVTLSAGAAPFEGHAARMVDLADARLYEAKRAGRNRTVFDPDLDRPAPVPAP